jgi:hypothetical protein
VVVCEVPLNRLEEQLIRLARELRPALAYGNTALSLFDRLHRWLIFLELRPAENLGALL